MILMEKKLQERFKKQNCKKQIKKSLELKKQQKKGDKLYVKWKRYNNLFNSLFQYLAYNLPKYSPKPKSLGVNVKVELDFTNYARKQI